MTRVPRRHRRPPTDRARRARWPAALIAGLLVFRATHGAANEPRLVADLDRALVGCHGSTIVRAGSVALFGTQSTCLGGVAVWRTDGTPTGTVPVTPISGPGDLGRIDGLVGVGGVAYLLASPLAPSSEPQPTELWRSDGSEAGTIALRRFAPPELFGGRSVVAGDRLVFVASDGRHGMELWASDGTVSGTRMIRDLEPGPGGSFPGEPVSAGDGLVFHAVTRGGYVLYRTDGTHGGTRRLAGGPDSPFVHMGSLTSGPDGAYFLALRAGDRHPTVWRTDGSRAGTRPIGTLPAFGRWHLAGRSSFVLTARRGSAAILRLDHDTGELLVLRDFPFARAQQLYRVGELGDVIYFGRRFRAAGARRGELWRSDGTAEGTIPLAPVSSLGDAVASGPRLFFSGLDADAVGLWGSDGTAAGTAPVPGPVGGGPPDRIALEGTVLYLDAAQVLWRTDGTPAGTVRVAELPDVLEQPAVRDGDALFFSGARLWRSDGTTAGTTPIVRLGRATRGSHPSDLTDVDGTLFFRMSGEGFGGCSVWRSDGTTAGTWRVADGGRCDTSADRLTAGRGRILFTVGERELWSSDGAAAGARKLIHVASSTSWAAIAAEADFGESLLVALRSGDGASPQGLWRYDHDGRAGELLAGAAVRRITPAGDAAFLGVAGEGGEELWRTDGTAAGTVPVATFEPAHGGRIESIVAAGDGVYFDLGRVGTTELWRSDGTPGGAVRVAELAFDSAVESAQPLRDAVFAGGALYFTFDDHSTGRKLWRSDAAGTRPIAAIPVVEGSIAAVGDALYFCSGDPDDPRRVWRWDGGANAPRPAFRHRVTCDGDLEAVGGQLFFPGMTPKFGRELWALE